MDKHVDIKGRGSTSQVQHPLTMGIVRPQFLLLRGTTWFNNVVAMHLGLCEHYVQSLVLTALGLVFLFACTFMHCDNNPSRTGPNPWTHDCHQNLVSGTHFTSVFSITIQIQLKIYNSIPGHSIATNCCIWYNSSAVVMQNLVAIEWKSLVSERWSPKTAIFGLRGLTA